MVTIVSILVQISMETVCFEIPSFEDTDSRATLICMLSSKLRINTILHIALCLTGIALNVLSVLVTFVSTWVQILMEAACFLSPEHTALSSDGNMSLIESK